MSKASDPFAALAHPTRREILERLRDHPGMSAGEIAAGFPSVSRPAISRHLSVLRRANLVGSRTSGRECHYAVDARPLADIYERYLRAFAPIWDQSLPNLKHMVEAGLPEIP